MPRTVKRYENRKLYDGTLSRYVGLEEIAAWIRGGEEICVIDNATGADVTAQTLARVVSEESHTPKSLPSDLLHYLIRIGGKVVTGSLEQLGHGLDRAIESVVERLPVVRQTRAEVAALRRRLEEIESSMKSLEE